jgi:hypothetical protein
VPRKSAEDRSAAYWRTGGKPIAQPAHLDGKVRAVWRVITASKPPDYFSPASAPLLESLCEAVVMRRFYSGLWHRAPDNHDYVRAITSLNGSISQLSTKLRLALTSIDKRSGLLTENEPAVDADDNVILFGGAGPARF